MYDRNPLIASFAASMPRLTLVLVLSVAQAGLPAQGAAWSDDAAIGVWPWLVGNIDNDVPTIIQTAQTAGLDTIYVHLWRTTGPSQGTLHMIDEAGNWGGQGLIDPDLTLRNLIAQAHAAHLQVVGVVNCFLSGGPLPGDAAHEALLLSVVDYLIDNFDAAGAPWYALDGIALDRVRFYTGTGNPAAAVTSFVQQVKDRCGLLPLHAYLPANLWHIDGPPYDGVFRTYSDAMFWLETQYGHDWEALAHILDVFLPMAYVAEGGPYGNQTSLMQAYLTTVASYARQAQMNAGVAGRLLPAIRAWNDSTGTTTSASLSACIAGAAAGGADGYMPFRYYTAAGQTSWWNAIGAGAVAAPAFPRAALTATTGGGLGLTLDATASTSANATTTLEAQFDVDDDGIPDTAWSTNLSHTFLAPSSSPLTVTVRVRDSAGRVSVRKRRVTPLGAQLTVSGGWTSISQGSNHTLVLNAGPAAAGMQYVIAASVTGTSPGTVLTPTINVPLNWDWMTDLVLAAAGTPILPGFVGSLDANGWAGTAFAIPGAALPGGLSGQSIHLAAVGFDPQWAPTFSSGSVSLTVFP